MRMRPGPVYPETGLAIPPRKRDCVGDECPIVAQIGRCFVDDHHLYANERYQLALGYPYTALRVDPHAIIKMARCRHNSSYPRAWHSQFDYTEPARLDAVYRYLEESRILRRMNLVVADLGKDIEKFFSDNPRVRHKMHSGGYESTMERIYINTQVLDSCMERATTEIEVIPSVVCGRVITQIGQRRNELAQRVVRLPELSGILMPLTSPQPAEPILP